MNESYNNPLFERIPFPKDISFRWVKEPEDVFLLLFLYMQTYRMGGMNRQRIHLFIFFPESLSDRFHSTRSLMGRGGNTSSMMFPTIIPDKDEHHETACHHENQKRE
jgi:hypothetical protein